MEKIDSNINTKSYIWWKDRKMMGTIILISSICFQVFAWFKIPFLSSINGYTIGMFIGFYHPLFYIACFYYGLNLIFDNKIKMPHWVKLNELKYIFLCLSIIFIGVSTSYYQGKGSYITIGANTWKETFDNWWNNFTSSSSAWVPKSLNGGILGAFMYSFSTMIISGIGSFVLSIILLCLNISLIITGSMIGLYRDLLNRHKLVAKHLEKTSEISLNIDKDLDKIKNEKSIGKNEELPFEDPFS